MTIFVFGILRWRIPSEVFDIVIAWIGIGKMTSVDSAERRFPLKGKQYQAVDLAHNNPSAEIKRDCNIPLSTTMRAHQARWAKASRATIVAAFALEGPYRAIVADKIMRVAGNLSEFLCHSLSIPTSTYYVNGNWSNA